VRNRELKELRRIIDELENIRNGEDELDLKSEEEIEVGKNVEEGDPSVDFISLLCNRGSVRVEFSCYDDCWVAKIRHFIHLSYTICRLYFHFILP
jgi:hypothetical protein